MYAIVEIAGHQYKVQKDQQVYVNRLQAKEGDKVSFDRVLLLDDNNGSVTVGAPAIDGATISAKVVKHLKGDKVIVFKKKRRKGYRKKNGFRPYLTELSIESIGGKGSKKSEKAAAPKSEAKESAPKAEKKETATKKETSPKAETKAAPKKETAKKADEKKAEPKAKTEKPAEKKETASSSSAKASESSEKAETKKSAPKKSDDNKEEK